MHLYKRITWPKHIVTKRKQLGLKLTSLNWLLGKSSNMSTENKLLVYKAIWKLIWTYGIQLWRSVSKSNIEIIQRFQPKVLRQLVSAPWIVTNETIHKDLNMPTVLEESTYANKYCSRLNNHPNILESNSTDRSGLLRTFFTRTARLWSNLPADIFPISSNISLFKARINQHFLSPPSI